MLCSNPSPPRLRAIHIAHADDPRLEEYRDIRDRDARGAGSRPGAFIGEQFLIVEKMLARPGMTRSILIAPQHLPRFEERLIVSRESDEPGSAAPMIPLYITSPQVMETIAGFPVHRGVLAAGNRPSPASLSIDAAIPDRGGRGPLTLLLCEEIRNIDNIGALFRNAAAFGVNAVVLSPGCHDPLYRKSIRVSIGHVLALPWARSRGDWTTDLQRLRQEWNVTLIAASTHAGGGNAVLLDALAPPQRVGIVVGSEFAGISPSALAICDHAVRIPMAVGVDSLNVATAAAIILHRFSRSVRV